MSVVKSELLKELTKNYPSFLKDLIKFFDITLNEIRDALKRSERVEFRDLFTMEPRIQKREYPETLKQTKTLIHLKKTIVFKNVKKMV